MPLKSIGSGLCLGLGLTIWLLAGSAHAQSAPDPAPQTGTTLIGAVGIRESVREIMARAQIDDARGHGGVRIKYEFENEFRHPHNRPESPVVASWPPLADSSPNSDSAILVPDAAQTVSTPNFTGATLADTGAFPPDTMGTVGPSQFIVAVNGRVRSFNKLTGVADGALNADTDVFFSSVMTPGTNFTSDPRIRYDRLSGRWFVIIIDVPGGNGNQANRVLLAVSSGDTITASSDFTFYQFQMSGSLFADYPTLGIDANALYIGANMFTLGGSFSSTLGSVVRKSSVLSGGPIVATTFTLVATAGGAGPYTPQGVDNYDPAATEGYFIGVDNATFGTLMVRRVNTPGATPTLSGNLTLTVPSTSFPLKVPHSGNTGGNNGRLDALDDRLYAAHLRNGRLWTAHNIGTNATGTTTTATRNSVRWYELGNLSTTPTLIQSGTIFSTAASNPEYYFIPSVMVSGQGHAAMGFSMAGLALTPNAGTVGRLSSDALGTVQTPIANYSGSTATYNPPSDSGGAGGRRWGDYSYTSLDPCDDMTLWTIQEFANATNSYGVRAVRLLAPAPTANACAASTDISQGQNNVAIAVTGAGFFSPAAAVGGCRIPLAASVGGSGVSVNTATFNSPTSLSLDISASVAAAPGARSITITNPDGQTTIASGCINVVAGSTATVTSLNRIGSGAICVGQSLSWQAQFSESISGGDSSNYALVGGSAAAITSVNGSGNTRSISANVGTAAGSLRLDLVNSSGLTPAPTNLPFAGETVSINANPAVFNVSGGGSYCSGGSGVAVGLSGSEAGVNYQLELDGVPIGASVAGSGGAISFGNQTAAGSYTVSASNGLTACASAMSGNVLVAIDPVPGVNSVSPAAICSGSATNIALVSTPAGASFSYTASNIQGSISGFADGSSNPIAQTLTGSGKVSYQVTATLGSCPGAANAILQSVSDPTPTADSLPDGTEQVPYTFNLSAPGALQPAQFQIVSGSLPVGLSLSLAGVLSGTPTSTGDFNFTVSGSDPGIAACAFDRAYSLSIRLRDIFKDGFE